MKIRKCQESPAPGGHANVSSSPIQELTAMIYPLKLYKSYFIDKSERSYCSDCGKPQRIADNDLAELYSSADYCICRRSRHG